MGKQDRGFASMDPEKQRQIASKGGRSAHAKGRAHQWTVDEAREAGRKGGTASRQHAAALPSAARPEPEEDQEKDEPSFLPPPPPEV